MPPEPFGTHSWAFLGYPAALFRIAYVLHEYFGVRIYGTCERARKRRERGNVAKGALVCESNLGADTALAVAVATLSLTLATSSVRRAGRKAYSW